jgi:2-aminobenzoylacetyl-CoA thioesterase
MFPRKINDSLWILGNNYFHIYLVKGSNTCALVETGISATADILLEQLSSVGVKPDYLIVTHPHSDHITGLNHLRNAFPEAIVMAGKGAEEFISHPKAGQSMIMEDHHMNQSFALLGYSSRRPAITSVTSISGCKVINDGEELNLGGLSIRFSEVKGHSPGNILIYMPDTGTVLVSDSLGNHYPGRGFFPTFFTGFIDYLETIDRLEKLNPLNVGLAHNGFFLERKEIKNIFNTAKKSALDAKAYILKDKRGDEEIASDLFRFYYNDELKIYSSENILNCCRLLVRRIKDR